MPPHRRLGLLLGLLATVVATRTADAQQGVIALSLGDAARLAARQNAGAVAARYRTEQADARAVQRRSELLPNISGLVLDNERTFNSASFGISIPGAPGQPPVFPPDGTVLGPVKNWDFRGRLTQTLVDFGAFQRLGSARAMAAAYGADANNVADLAASAGAIAYLRVLRAEAAVRARTADSLLAQELIGIAQDQLTSGVGIGLDVTRARSQAAATRAQLIAARAERDRSRLDLQRALGLSLDQAVTLTDSLGLTASIIPYPGERDAIDNALRARPDLAALGAQLEAQRRAVSAVGAERYPTVAAFADQGVTGISLNRLLNTYTWGVQVSIPIFEGFRHEGRATEQSAALRELEVRERDLRQQVAIEVRGALLDVASAREQADAAQVRLRLAEQELSEARDRFKAGVAGNSDVIQSSLQLNGARTLLVDALTQYHVARLAVARVQGAITRLP